ncbi:piwi-like protein Ago3 isoform X2 [Cephus cinctus]|uniref:Piwi-like protein Ago3 isoform X2 n=1 Tax=Cephus cinctus TaxID=211228 RepID=A0AAJ7RI93_CEPCN|nr:piwi-like protein Ago3 isoform X2 [Cephus cinctus]
MEDSNKGPRPPGQRTKLSLLDLMKMKKAGTSQDSTLLSLQMPGTSQSTEQSTLPLIGRGRATLTHLQEQSADIASVGRGFSSPNILSPSRSIASPELPQALPKVGRGRASVLGMKQSLITTAASVSETQLPQGRKLQSSVDVGHLTTHLPQLSLSTTESLTQSEPISRQGEAGTVIEMTANHINLVQEPDRGLFQYEVTFAPNIDSRPLRTKLLNQHLAELGGVKTFDGAILFVPKKLKQDRMIFSSLHPDGSTVILTLIYKKEQSVSENIQFYNILIGKIMYALKLVRIGRQNFNPRAAHAVPQHRLELWPGYVTAVNEYEGGLKLCLDATHRVMRTDTVRDLMKDTYNKSPHNFRDTVTVEVVGMTVLTRYNNRTYHIDDIDWNKSPKFEFESKDNTKTSLIQYYKTHWNLDIKDHNQPLLVHRAKTRTNTGEEVENLVLLIPEFCYLAGLTDKIRSDFRIMRDLASVTRVSPEGRRDVIHRFINEVQNNEVTRKLLSDWGLRLENNTVNINGRVLPREKITFGNKNSDFVPENADWTSMTIRKPALRSVSMRSWCLIFTGKDSSICKDFLVMLKKVGMNMSLNIADPKIIQLENDRTENYLRELRRNINPNVDIVVAVCPSIRNDRYAAIKKLCCVEMPIASQVIVTKTISRKDKLKGVSEKIALQMNCKLGGALWALHIPFENLMVCGIDVFHAGEGKSSHGSVAGFVASLDKHLTTWYSKVCIQTPRQELIDLLKVCLVAAVNKYEKTNSRYPDRIVMYRDGVGDGQLDTVSRYEVNQLETAFSLIYPDYKPKMNVVVVQKRINTRLFRKVISE